MKEIGFYEGRPTEISFPSTVVGQLIVCGGKDFYIVVATRNIEQYYEPSKPNSSGRVTNEPHYKIGGFIKVDPKTLKKHDGVNKFVPCNFPVDEMPQYEVKSEQELSEYLKVLYAKYLAEIEAEEVQFGKCNSGFHAGCNYNINKGTDEWEPLGSATSMHDCDGCEKLSDCELKKTDRIWFHDKKQS